MMESQNLKTMASQTNRISSIKQSKNSTKRSKKKKLKDEKKEHTQYEFLKVINRVENVPLLNIVTPFNAAEIADAQTRHLNKIYFQRREEIERRKLKKLQEESDEESDEEFEQKEEQELNQYELVEPLKRTSGGYWIQF